MQLDAWQRRPDGPGRGVLHGIAYGIGTDRHRGLLRSIREDVRLPGEARSTAAWPLTTPHPPAFP